MSPGCEHEVARPFLELVAATTTRSWQMPCDRCGEILSVRDYQLDESEKTLCTRCRSRVTRAKSRLCHVCIAAEMDS